MTGAGAQLFDDLMRFRPDGLSPNGWAVKAGVSRTIWADLRRHGNPSRRTLEKLLTAAGSSLAEFEALRVGGTPPPDAGPTGSLADPTAPAWRPAQLPPIPLLETYQADEWGEDGSGIAVTGLRPNRIQGHIARPASMAGDRDAYALAISDDAMWPRFRPGRHLLVSPAAPISAGDDVAVRLKAPTGGAASLLIKELVQRTADFVELRQFNPDLTFRVEAADIAAIH